MAPGLLRISEAGSLALHTVAILARSGDRLSTQQVAETLQASEHHLAKVLQRLAKAGLVRSARGPGGGFVLTRAPEDITVLEVFEVIEGPLSDPACLFQEPVCDGKACILGGLLQSVHKSVYNHFARTKVSDLAKRIHLGGTS